MADKKYLGVATNDMVLDGGATISGATISGSTVIGGTVSGAALTANSGVFTVFRASTSVSFFDVSAAIAQPSGAAQAAVATTAATTGAATYGLTSAQMNGVVTLLNKIRTDLVALGLIKGS